MSVPTLSVTVTSYNYAQYIGETIESILKQTFTDFELIIVDDVSPDNSVEIIKSYAQKDNRIRFVEHTKNIGGTLSLIEASDLARGRYLVNIDSDDWIRDEKAFELQVEMLEKNPNITFVYSPVAHIQGEECTLLVTSENSDTIFPGEKAVENVLRFYVAHSGTMVRTSAYKACGGYNPGFEYSLDIKLWADLCILGDVGYINQVLYAYRQHSNSMTKLSRTRLWQQEHLRIIESVFASSLRQKMSDPELTYSRVLQNMLLAGPTHEIFSGRYKRGWKLYWASLTLRPRQTLQQKRNLSLVARTLLGSKGYRGLELLYSKVSLKKREKLQNSYSVRSRLLG